MTQTRGYHIHMDFYLPTCEFDQVHGVIKSIHKVTKQAEGQQLVTDAYVTSLVDERKRYDNQCRCWYCGGEVYWLNDWTPEDYGYDREGIVTDLMCSDCGANIQYVLLEEEAS